MRGNDSLCQSPSGKVGVTDGLLIASFVLSLHEWVARLSHYCQMC